MTIPGFQDIMLPLLYLSQDRQEHKLSTTRNQLANHFELTKQEREQLLPSGRQTTFSNRVSWASTYLKKTKLLESTGRGRFRITERGLKVLEEPPQRIDLKFLDRYDELEEFRNRSSATDDKDTKSVEDEVTDTPDETFEDSFLRLRRQLASDLLDQIHENSPEYFERLVVDLMLAMGYGGTRRDAGEATRLSRDGGIDGVIKEDKLGLSNIYLQAKRWENTVGRPEVQNFSGALDMHRANRGVFITTSSFSKDAREFVMRIGKRIILIDGNYLAQLMIEHEVGVIHKETYILYEIDENYFVDE